MNISKPGFLSSDGSPEVMTGKLWVLVAIIAWMGVSNSTGRYDALGSIIGAFLWVYIIKYAYLKLLKYLGKGPYKKAEDNSAVAE